METDNPVCVIYIVCVCGGGGGGTQIKLNSGEPNYPANVAVLCSQICP